IYKWIGLLHVVKALHEIDKWFSAPVAVDAIDECLAVSGRAAWIDLHHYVTIRRHQLRVPAVRPFIAPCSLGATVDQKLHRVLLLRVKRRRLYQKAFHLSSDSAGKPERLDRLRGYLGQYRIIEMAELLRLFRAQGQLVNLSRGLGRHAGENQGLAVGRKHQVVIRAPHNFLHGRALANINTINRGLTFIIRAEINRFGIRSPGHRAYPVVEALSEVAGLSALAVVDHQLEPVTLVSGTGLHSPGQVTAIGRVKRG